jgi:hypothetical protein
VADELRGQRVAVAERAILRVIVFTDALLVAAHVNNAFSSSADLRLARESGGLLRVANGSSDY